MPHDGSCAACIVSTKGTRVPSHALSSRSGRTVKGEPPERQSMYISGSQRQPSRSKEIARGRSGAFGAHSA